MCCSMIAAGLGLGVYGSVPRAPEWAITLAWKQADCKVYRVKVWEVRQWGF